MQIKYPDALPDALAFIWGDHELRIVVPFDVLIAAQAFLVATELEAEDAVKMILHRFHAAAERSGNLFVRETLAEIRQHLDFGFGQRGQ